MAFVTRMIVSLGCTVWLWNIGAGENDLASIVIWTMCVIGHVAWVTFGVMQCLHFSWQFSELSDEVENGHFDVMCCCDHLFATMEYYADTRARSLTWALGLALLLLVNVLTTSPHFLNALLLTMTVVNGFAAFMGHLWDMDNIPPGDRKSLFAEKTASSDA